MKPDQVDFPPDSNNTRNHLTLQRPPPAQQPVLHSLHVLTPGSSNPAISPNSPPRFRHARSTPHNHRTASDVPTTSNHRCTNHTWHRASMTDTNGPHARTPLHTRCTCTPACSENHPCPHHSTHATISGCAASPPRSASRPPLGPPTWLSPSSPCDDGHSAHSPPARATFDAAHTAAHDASNTSSLHGPQGSPAHAGIDRNEFQGQPVGHRFPRTRGDRPHYAGWTVDAPPGDWLSHTPIPFLTVAPGAAWLFGLMSCGGAGNGALNTGWKWLTEALAWAGSGAKTAVGYSHLVEAKADTDALIERIEAAERARESETRRQLEIQTPEGRWRVRWRASLNRLLLTWCAKTWKGESWKMLANAAHLRLRWLQCIMTWLICGKPAGNRTASSSAGARRLRQHHGQVKTPLPSRLLKASRLAYQPLRAVRW